MEFRPVRCSSPIERGIDPNLDLTFDEDEYERSREEEEAKTTFESLRIPCLVHSIQLLAKFIIKNCKENTSLQTALKLVGRLQKSTVATEIILRKSQKKLVSFSLTRWNGIYFVLDRLLELKLTINACVEELNWDGLLQSQWSELEKLKNLLKPMADLSEELASQKKCTTSLVIPYLYVIEQQLNQISDQRLKETVLQQFNKRFQSIFDISCSDFEPLYAICTFFDLRYTNLLNIRKYSILKQVAQQEIVKMNPSYSLEINTKTAETPANNQKSASPLLALLDSILEQHELRKLNESTIKKPVDDEIARYLMEKKLDKEAAPIRFWSEAGIKCKFPLLSSVACDLLVVPASSASVERVFSAAGLPCLGRRNRLHGKNLRNIVMLKLNTAWH